MNFLMMMVMSFIAGIALGFAITIGIRAGWSPLMAVPIAFVIMAGVVLVAYVSMPK